MITLNPAVPTKIFQLERHETFGDYARRYGDEITRAYEADQVIYFPHFPLPLNLEFFQNITFPKEWKKIGTFNGIARDAFTFSDGKLTSDLDGHPLAKIVQPANAVVYMLQQVRETHLAIFEALARVLPHYHSLRGGNITWRFTETANEGMHIDGFAGGAPRGQNPDHRVKLFINVDSLPRHWRISYDVITMLDVYADKLGDNIPEDLNVLAHEIGRLQLLADAPYHDVQFPQMSAVLANAEAIAHSVVYGRRMICAELFCDARDMLDREQQPHAKLARWFKKRANRMPMAATA